MADNIDSQTAAEIAGEVMAVQIPKLADNVMSAVLSDLRRAYGEYAAVPDDRKPLFVDDLVEAVEKLLK